MDLIEASPKEDKAANPGAINTIADAQGNTPLHYAVAQRDLELIERLIKQGAPITAENLQGETAADWFQEFIVSIYKINPRSQLEELTQEIEENNIQFITDCLRAGVSRTLRYSGGETLLHIAIAAQQKATIELLLDEIDHKAIRRLLSLTNRRGLTPIALAQQRCQPGTQVAQGILSYLQAKQRAAEEGKPASAIQTQTSCFDLEPIPIKQQELRSLAHTFMHPCILVDFEQLNPLRSTLVKLAYNIALQASDHLAKLASFRKQRPLIEKLLQRLFGVWDDNTRLNFEKKLYSVLDYLYKLIQQRLVDQVIQFSNKKSNAKGWCNYGENKIFLNPTIMGGTVALVTTFIHEVTHQVDHTYDFFLPGYAIHERKFFIDLNSAYQLAAAGTAKSLPTEKRRLFEIRQLLEEGFSDSWQKNLYQWMAINSAETLALATLALASMPVGAAQFERWSQRTILTIRPQKFSDDEVITVPFGSPVLAMDLRAMLPRERTPESVFSSPRSDESSEKSTFEKPHASLEKLKHAAVSNALSEEEVTAQLGASPPHSTKATKYVQQNIPGVYCTSS